MRPNAQTLKPRGPLTLLALVVVGLVPLLITLGVAPPGTGRQAALADRAVPPQPHVPAKHLVPVRGDAPPDRPAAPGEQVALRQLIVATDERDFGLAAWRSVLDRIGTPYDVLLTKDDPIDEDALVRDDGTGRYNAILLTNNTLTDASGSSDSVSSAEWDRLWQYERTYKVRQVALNASPDTLPCLRAESEEPVGKRPVDVGLTAEGRKVFDYLAPGAKLPLSESYVYRSQPAPGCRARPLLTLGSSVVGYVDRDVGGGREELSVGFSMGPDDMMIRLLGFGLVRWATRGVFLGEQRHWLNVDADDWFLTTLRGPAPESGPVRSYRATGPEMLSLSREQEAFRKRYPLAGDFRLNLAFNGSLLDPDAPATCHPDGTADDLSSYSLCLKDEFRWINHTMTHPQMNTTPYERDYNEINDNLARAAAVGLPVPATVLKTPEYSGLGAYADRPDSLDPPVDHGLEASNKDLLRAAADLGVKYMHGNIDFPGHQPSCFNCGIRHPLERDVMVVPDWPTMIAFQATNPAEQVALYRNTALPKDSPAVRADYRRTIDEQADVALAHLMSGSVYSHTLHQGNAHAYAPGHSLAFDWLNALLARYSRYYDVPLRNVDWLTLATYADQRTRHFAELDHHKDAVWNRVTGAVTYTPGGDNSLFVTGVETRPATAADQRGPDEAEKYGSDTVSRLGLTEGETVTLKARPR
ncbi:Agd3-related carbohydrate-binding protein [Streptomyces sp. NPDC004822]